MFTFGNDLANVRCPRKNLLFSAHPRKTARIFKLVYAVRRPASREKNTCKNFFSPHFVTINALANKGSKFPSTFS